MTEGHMTCIQKEDLREVQLVHVAGGGRSGEGYMTEVTLKVPNELAAQILTSGSAHLYDSHLYDGRRNQEGVR